MSILNRRERQILRYILRYRSHSGTSPCLREIGSALGITKQAVLRWTQRLRRRGLLTAALLHSTRNVVPVCGVLATPDGAVIPMTPDEAEELLARIPHGEPHHDRDLRNNPDGPDGEPYHERKNPDHDDEEPAP